MTTILVSVVAALGFFAWAIALLSAIRIVRLAPSGRRLSVYGQIGWWQFDAVRAAIGPHADPHIVAYRRAFATFMCCVIAAMLAGLFLGAAAQN